MRKKRTYKDVREANIRNVTKRRKEIRLMVIEHAGGKCIKCGYHKYPEVMEFHHRDPLQKDFNVSKKGLTRSWERVKKEIEKCELFCATPHRELHVEQKLAASRENSGMKSE